MSESKKSFLDKFCLGFNDCSNCVCPIILSSSRINSSRLSSPKLSNSRLSSSRISCSSNKLEFINRVKNIRCELNVRRLKKKEKWKNC